MTYRVMFDKAWSFWWPTTGMWPMQLWAPGLEQAQTLGLRVRVNCKGLTSELVVLLNMLLGAIIVTEYQNGLISW